MLNIVQFRQFVLLGVFALGVAACGKSADDARVASPLTDTAGLLGYVPDDTPYVFGILEPLPDDLMDRIEPKLDRLLAAYSEMLRIAVSEGQPEAGGDTGDREKSRAVADELRSLMSLQSLREAGVTRDSTAVFYGNGLLPVLRIGLSDVSLFEEAIAGIEEKAGEQLPVAQVEDTRYRYIEDEGVRWIIATSGDHLVLTVAPDRNIAQSGKLRAMADEYGFLHEYLGLVDTVRLADTFIDQPEGLDALLLDVMGYDAGRLGDVCKAEFRSLAGIAPRLVSGYEEFSADAIRSVTVVELRDDVAGEFMRFVAPVPGLGPAHDSLFSLGMSLNVQAMRTFFDTRVAALAKDPWECEHLEEIQDGLVAARERALAQPVPPILYDLHGFLAVIDDMQGFDFSPRQPPEEIDASFLLAIDNAQGLVAMGQAMIPQLAATTIEPDGKAHRFDLGAGQAGVESAWIALTDSAVAISVSDDADTILPAMLRAEPGAPPPFASMGLDGERYYTLLGEAMRENDDEELSEDMREALADVIDVAADFYERLQIDLTFTERGIEIDTDMSLAE